MLIWHKPPKSLLKWNCYCHKLSASKYAMTMQKIFLLLIKRWFIFNYVTQVQHDNDTTEIFYR
jgi:hypothetical protein